MSDTSRAPASPAEIEAEIERTREQLAASIDRISDRVSPKNVARRGIDSARSQVTDGHGQLRTGRVAGAVGALGGFVAVLLWRRRR